MEKLWEAPKASIAAPAMTSSVLPVAPAYKPPIPSAPPAPIPHNPSLATLISLDEWNEALSKDDTWREGVRISKKDWKLVNGSPFFRLRKYVLPELRSHVLYERHDSLLTGHPGHAKTISLVTRDYNWPLLPKDVQRYVQSCDTCQQTKPSHHAPYGELVPLNIPQGNWDEISMDFITDLPSSHSYDSILIVVDRLTKQAHFIPTHKALNTPSLVQLFIPNIFKLHGFPSSIVSD